MRSNNVERFHWVVVDVQFNDGIRKCIIRKSGFLEYLRDQLSKQFKMSFQRMWRFDMRLSVIGRQSMGVNQVSKLGSDLCESNRSIEAIRSPFNTL